MSPLAEAQAQRRAFSWVSTGMVCQRWSAHYAAIGFWGRNKK